MEKELEYLKDKFAETQYKRGDKLEMTKAEIVLWYIMYCESMET